MSKGEIEAKVGAAKRTFNCIGDDLERLPPGSWDIAPWDWLLITGREKLTLKVNPPCVGVVTWPKEKSYSPQLVSQQREKIAGKC